MKVADEMVEAASEAAFWQDDLGGHVKGPWTWDTIPEEGRENYRTMIRAALGAIDDPDPNPFADPRMWKHPIPVETVIAAAILKAKAEGAEICPNCCPACHRHGGTFCHCTVEES